MATNKDDKNLEDIAKNTKDAADSAKANKESEAKASSLQAKKLDSLNKHTENVIKSAKENTTNLKKALEDDIAGNIKEQQIGIINGLTDTAKLTTTGLHELSAKDSKLSAENFAELEGIKIAADKQSDIFKDSIANKLSGRLGEMADNIADGNRAAIKKDSEKLIQMKKQLDYSKGVDRNARVQLENQFRSLDNLQKISGSQDKALVRGFKDLKEKIGPLTPAILGVTATLLSDSGIAGLGLMWAAGKIQQAAEAKAEMALEEAKQQREDSMHQADLDATAKLKEVTELSGQFVEKKIEELDETQNKVITAIEAKSKLETSAIEEGNDNLVKTLIDISILGRQSNTKSLSNISDTNIKIAGANLLAQEKIKDELIETLEENKSSVTPESTEEVKERKFMFQKLIDATKSIGAGLLDSAKNKKEKAKGVFSGIANMFKNLKKIAKNLVPMVKGFVTSMGGFKGILSKGLVGTVLLPLMALGNGIFQAVEDILKLPDSADFATIVLTGLRGMAEGILEVLIGLPIQLIDWIAGTDITGFIDEQGGIISTLGNLLSSFWKSLIGTVESVIQTIPFMGDFKFDRSEGPDAVINESNSASDEKLEEQIAEGLEAQKSGPGFLNFLGSTLGLTDSYDTDMEQLRNAQAEKNRRTSAMANEERQASRNSSAGGNIISSNSTAVNNVSTPTTHIHQKKKPRNNEYYVASPAAEIF